MKKQEKIFTVQNLAAKLKEAKSVVLADYRGLTVAQLTQLRHLAKKAGGELTVAKNTLIKRALGGLPLELTGPTAVIIAYEDELSPLKTTWEFAKNAGGMPTFKSGIWEGELITSEEIERLARLPSKQELQIKLIGVFASPLFGLVRVLSANQGKLILILKTVSKGGEN